MNRSENNRSGPKPVEAEVSAVSLPPPLAALVKPGLTGLVGLALLILMMFVAGPAAAQVLNPKEEGANAEHQSKEAAEETEKAVEEVTYTEAELEMVRLINEHRENNGLDPLLVSDSASLAAERHSADMAKYGYMDHESQQSEHFETGADSSDRLAESGYAHNTTTGENIAADGSAQAVFEGWKESPDHDEIMLHEDLEVIGVGMERADSKEDGDGKSYWTTDFGGVEGEDAREVSEIEPEDTPQGETSEGEESGHGGDDSASGDQYDSSGDESSNEDSNKDSKENSGEDLPDEGSSDDPGMTTPEGTTSEGTTPEVTIHDDTEEQPDDTAKEQTKPDEQSSDEQSPDQEATEPEPDQGTGQSPQDEAEDEGTTQGSTSPENPGSDQEDDTPINGPANHSGGDEPSGDESSGDEPTEEQPQSPSGDQYGSGDEDSNEGSNEGSNETPDGGSSDEPGTDPSAKQSPEPTNGGGDGQDQPDAGPTGESGTEPGGGPEGSGSEGSGEDCDTMEGFDNDPFRADFGSDLEQRIQSKVDCHLADAGIGGEDSQPTAESPDGASEGDESTTIDDGG